MGELRSYLCDRCPLFLELGGHAAFGDGAVAWRQIVCGGCGTMNRLTKTQQGTQVAALSGPVRTPRTVADHLPTGESFERIESPEESEWQGATFGCGSGESLESLACTHCGAAGRMLTLQQLLYPAGYSPGAAREERCPLCRTPLRLVAVSDLI